MLYDVEIINIQDEDNYKIMLHDFETSKNLKYEVKADYASEITGNFFVNSLMTGVNYQAYQFLMLTFILFVVVMYFT